MAENTNPNEDHALEELARHRRIARKWGLILVGIGLALGALLAPQTTWIVFLALIAFGAFGIAVGWATGQIGRWIGQPKS